MINLSFLKSKKTKEKEIKESLRVKLQKILTDLSWTKSGYKVERIVDFFNYMEKALKGITEKERIFAPKCLKNVIGSTGRCESGWFRAPKDQEATPDNTFIQPTGHWDEFFKTHTVRLLMNHSDQPSDQGGFAKKPMTTLEFYYEAFVRPFVKDKIEALEISLKEI